MHGQSSRRRKKEKYLRKLKKGERIKRRGKLLFILFLHYISANIIIYFFVLHKVVKSEFFVDIIKIVFYVKVFEENIVQSR